MKEIIQNIDGPTWVMIAGGLIAIAFSVIVGWMEKERNSLRVLSTIAAVGGLLTLIGGVWAGHMQKSATAEAATQDIVRLNLRLRPSLVEYQSRIGLMHRFYNDNRNIEQGFDFDVMSKLLYSNMLNPDDGYFTRVSFVDLYFDSQAQLHESIEQALLKMDRFRFSELADLLEEYQHAIEATHPDRMRERMSADAEEKTQIMRDGKLRTVVVRSLQIEAHDIRGKDQPTILKPYMELYDLINKSIVFRKKYDAIIEGIVKDR